MHSERLQIGIRESPRKFSCVFYVLIVRWMLPAAGALRARVPGEAREFVARRPVAVVAPRRGRREGERELPGL